jgi:hypothetical protein
VSATVVEAPAQPRARAERLLALFPLACTYIWLALLYMWQAWQTRTPWLFTDELEFTQISRAIAATGHAARRGQPYGFHSLYTFLIAPAWWISDVHAAYDAAKYIGVIVMAASVFPAYGLARLLVPPRYALFAAAGTAVVPAMAYSTLLIIEPLAYFYSTFCLFVIAKALLTRSRRWIGGAVVAVIVAPFVRTELGVLAAVLVLAALFLVWFSDGMSRRRAAWSWWDWAGFVALLIGAVIVFNSALGHRSYSYLIATRYYKNRMLDLGLWATGAFAIGLGLLPVVIGLSVLWRPRWEQRTPALRVFTSVFVSALIGFGIYTAVKAAYLSTVFATRVEERNLIYLAPLFFVATALWLQRPYIRLMPLALATAFVAYLIVDTPFQMDVKLYADAFGLAILQMANRELGFTPATAQWTLLVALAVGVLLLLAARYRRGTVVAVSLAVVLVLAWNLAGEISAGRASRATANSFIDNLPRPVTWLDEADQGQPALYLGQQIADADGIWETEFWNQSLKKVWSLDGTAPGPGPTQTPDLVTATGILAPQPTERYVMADAGVDLVGTVVARASHWRLYRLNGPLRLADAVTGIFADGWQGKESAFSQYASTGGRRRIAVSVGRLGWNGPDKPGRVVITVGHLMIGPDHQPHMGLVTDVRRWTAHSHIQKTFSIPAPPPPFRVEVTVSPTFSPGEFGASDRRQLGVQTSYALSR